MRNIAIILLVLIAFSGCKEKTAGSELSKGKLKVTVSILPQAFIVKNIAGDLIDVNVMVPPSSSPETYEPGPVKMAELKDSEIYFSIGMPFEITLLEKIAKDGSGMKIVEMQKNIVLRNIESHHHGHSSEPAGIDDEIKDPHIWLDPVILIQMAQNTVNELIRTDPKNRETYISNHLELKKKLQLLNDEMADLFKESSKKAFFIYHPAWGYFADRYGFRQIPVEIEGKEPSASEMAELTEIIGNNNIKYIFLQTQSPESVLKSISSETGAQIKMLDPLKEDVINNIRESAKAIKEGLIYVRRDH